MNRREFIRLAGGSVAALGFAGCAATSTSRKSGKGSGSKQPNLVFVFPDQMRGQALGFLDEDPVITPNLDKFASESLVLPQAVSNYPVCSPYRGMLMTGKYPHSNGVLSNCNSNGSLYGYELNKDDRCWSDVLKDKGYSLGYIGKWHLDAPYVPYVHCANNSRKFAWNEWCSPERRHGFDYWYAYGTYDYHNRPLYWSTDAGRNEFHYVDQWGPEHEADKAISFIRNDDGKYRDPDKPFAMVVSMNPPHTPYHLVPEKYKKMYADKTDEQLVNRPNVPPADERWGKYYRKNVRNYFAQVTGVDDQFGRILKELKAQGLDENTIVVFTSDHGNCLGCHSHSTKNVHWEESMRVPFIVRWPGKIKPRHDDLLISSPDIYPTLLEMMGRKRDIPQDVEGTSRADVFLTGQGERPDAQLYIWIPYGQPAYGRRGVRTHRYTLELTKKKGEGITKTILHDNKADPYQLKNIADEKPEVVTQLTEKLNAILARNSDPWLQAG
ncbi:Arylsulfatase [Anaerohalosphaera lusitana]|uniref:Arylsulfatase n=1 Tax=Anaerohalosphaera lusitana TaxID=1936003 RepID=A0A1U9NH98_9BACT|nr:sulfatase-like hydrolase/transferase [Anaerohalosphaera lusitana]AQT67303.1 Arylsulfatase [Anaerohalosphaera lusitana]